MTPRLFAYGGTSFVERRRIGEWTQLPMPVFEEYVGLRGGLPWFGFCTPKLQRPFLVWRVLQNQEQRGGYPFTLLLDPDDEVYERFGWNTGQLLAALFEAVDPPGRPLLEQPQSIKADDLWALLAGLTAPTSVPDVKRMDAEAARVYWTAGALTDDVLAVPPAALSLTERPSASWIGRRQGLLPMGLRNSGGWLVGGNAAQAEQLGVRLVLDDRAAVVETPSLQAARHLLAALDKASTLPPWAQPLVGGWLSQPAWVSRDGLARAKEAIVTVGQLSRSPEALADFADTLTDESERRQFFAGACEMLLATTHLQGPRVTRLLMEQAFDGVCRLRAKHYRLLDHEVVGRVLDERRIPPNPLPASVVLPPDVLLQRWTARAHDATRPFSPDEYDSFTGDPDWKELHRTLPDTGDALDRIVGALLGRRPVDLERLRQVAKWPARRRLSRERRAELATVAGGTWRVLAILDQLIAGAEPDNVPRADLEDEVLYQIRALGEVSPPPPPPNLAGLIQLIGELPQAVIEELATLAPSLADPARARAWVDAWASLDPSIHKHEQERLVNHEQQHALEQVLQGDATLPPVDELRRLLSADDARLTQTIAGWLRDPTRETLTRVVGRFATSAPHLAVLLETLGDAQRTAVASIVLQNPRVKVDRRFKVRHFRRAIETIRDMGALGIVLARAVLAAPRPPREPRSGSWWSRVWRQ